jgi:hypothetical protein
MPRPWRNESTEAFDPFAMSATVFEADSGFDPKDDFVRTAFLSLLFFFLAKGISTAIMMYGKHDDIL